MTATRMKNGRLVRERHKSTVISVLDTKAPSVRSFGNAYYNKDAWTMRSFVEGIMSKGYTPDQAKVYADGKIGSVTPEIVIANTPDEVSAFYARALEGGAIHEALHGLLSAKNAVPVEVVKEVERKLAIYDYN